MQSPLGRKTCNQVISIKNCWERQSHARSTSKPHLAAQEWALGPEYFTTKRESPFGRRQAYHLVWESLSWFQTQGVFLFLCSADACVSTARQHTTGFQVGLLLQQERGLRAGQLPRMATEQRGALPTRDERGLKLVLLCLFSM